MNTPFYIARRYLFSKKSHSVINVISWISIGGVALATLALVCTLSVFNGFHDLISRSFTNFDPDLKISPIKGKTFVSDSTLLQTLRTMDGVEVVCETLEDNAMAQYNSHQAMVTIKGVDEHFQELTSIDQILVGNPEFKLYDQVVEYGTMSLPLVYIFNSGVSFTRPLEVYAPRRGTKVNLANPMTNFTRLSLYSPGTVFRLEQEKYASHIVTSLDFARKLFSYTHEVSAWEVKAVEGVHVESLKKQIQALVGDEFTVKNRYEQQEDVYKIVKIEKFISYLFLSFILMIACFNIISSVSMLIIDKKNNACTLRSMGATDGFIAKVFTYEGNLIALFGAVAGLVLGIILCLLQQHFGLISLGDPGSFVVDAYPIRVKWEDILLVFATVIVVSSISVWLPIRLLNKNLMKK